MRKNAIRRQLLSVFVVLGLAAPVAAQTDITGTWELTLTAPTGPSTFDVKVVQSGEAITGELVSPLGNATFKGTLVDGVLAVSAPLSLQGNTVILVFDGKVTGDTLSGNVKFGDFGESTWTGKRKPAAASTAPAPTTTAPAGTTGASGGIAGAWNLEVDLPGNPQAMTAEFTQAGNIVTGTISGAQGDSKITGTMEGNTFKADFYAPGGLTIQMTGVLKGDTLTGKATLSGIGEVDWKGNRAK